MGSPHLSETPRSPPRMPGWNPKHCGLGRAQLAPWRPLSSLRGFAAAPLHSRSCLSVPPILMCSQSRAGVPSLPTQLWGGHGEEHGEAAALSTFWKCLFGLKMLQTPNPGRGGDGDVEKFHLGWKSLSPCWVGKALQDTQPWEEIPWVMPSAPAVEGSCLE